VWQIPKIEDIENSYIVFIIPILLRVWRKKNKESAIPNDPANTKHGTWIFIKMWGSEGKGKGQFIENRRIKTYIFVMGRVVWVTNLLLIYNDQHWMYGIREFIIIWNLSYIHTDSIIL